MLTEVTRKTKAVISSQLCVADKSARRKGQRCPQSWTVCSTRPQRRRNTTTWPGSSHASSLTSTRRNTEPLFSRSSSRRKEPRPATLCTCANDPSPQRAQRRTRRTRRTRRRRTSASYSSCSTRRMGMSGEDNTSSCGRSHSLELSDLL